MVNQVTSNTPATTQLNSKSNDSAANYQKDYDDFLTLLVTQLKNQDPSAPMDTNTFTQQIVQLSSVEQTINTNKNLESLVELTTNTQNSALVSYTGKLVEVEGSSVTKTDSGASFAYNIDDNKNVKRVFIEVSDQTTGKVVFNGEGTKTTGRNTVAWDGKDNDGEAAKNGVYVVKVSYSQFDSEELKEVPTFVGGRVDGVNLAAKPVTLVVNNEEIPLDKVNFIGNATS